MLSREQIIEAGDLQREIVEVPEWGGSVVVQEMTAADRIVFTETVAQRSPGANRHDVILDILQPCLVDTKGLPLFHGAEGREALGRKSGKVLKRLFEKAMTLNALGTEEKALEKNSEPAGAADLLTSSRGSSTSPT